MEGKSVIFPQLASWGFQTKIESMTWDNVSRSPIWLIISGIHSSHQPIDLVGWPTEKLNVPYYSLYILRVEGNVLISHIQPFYLVATLQDCFLSVAHSTITGVVLLITFHEVET